MKSSSIKYFSTTYYRDNTDFPSGNAQNTILWFQTVLNLVPKEHRHTAELYFDSENCRGNSVPCIILSWNRTMTKEEIQKEKEYQDKVLKNAKEREIALMLNLRDKYPNIP